MIGEMMGVRAIYESNVLRPLEKLDLKEGEVVEIEIKKDAVDRLGGLDHRARVVLGLFARHETITAPQPAAELGLSERMARNLIGTWVKDGWLEVANPPAAPEAIAYGQNIGYASADCSR